MKKRSVWVSLIFTLSLLLSSLWWTPPASAYTAYTSEQQLFLKAWRIVNRTYVDDTFNDQNWWFVRQNALKNPFQSREEAYDAIETMLASLDDPFTRLLRPDQYSSLQVSTSGELSGVGLQIDLDKNTGELEVVSPLVGSPAEQAGIQPLDRILTIDGVDTSTLTLDEAANRMRGPVGTMVTLEVSPLKSEEQTTYEIIRDVIDLNPVYAFLDEQTGTTPIGYIRLTQFSANATREIARSIIDLEYQGAEGFVLDLRNNPGGLLQAGVEIARLWLDDGVIVYTVNRQSNVGSFKAYGQSLTQAPLVVLVNQGSASASEILSGALHDNHRAQLVGEKTFGKGLIQSLFELPDNAGLAVTVAHYETPNHTDINKLGITPDRVVHQDFLKFDQVATQGDLQYLEAIKVLESKGLLAEAN